MAAPFIFRRRIALSGGDELRIELTLWRGTHLLQIRRWSINGAGKRVPTQKGVAIKAHLVGDIEQAIKQARRRAKRMGLLRGHGPS